MIYDCEKGTRKHTVNSKKYGVDLIHFTGNKAHVVHASTKENDIIRYLNVQENSYIRYGYKIYLMKDSVKQLYTFSSVTFEATRRRW